MFFVLFIGIESTGLAPTFKWAPYAKNYHRIITTNSQSHIVYYVHVQHISSIIVYMYTTFKIFRCHKPNILTTIKLSLCKKDISIIITAIEYWLAQGKKVSIINNRYMYSIQNNTVYNAHTWNSGQPIIKIIAIPNTTHTSKGIVIARGYSWAKTTIYNTTT